MYVYKMSVRKMGYKKLYLQLSLKYVIKKYIVLNKN